MVPLFELVCILAAIARYSLIYPAISYFLSPTAKPLSPLFKTMARMLAWKCLSLTVAQAAKSSGRGCNARFHFLLKNCFTSEVSSVLYTEMQPWPVTVGNLVMCRTIGMDCTGDDDAGIQDDFSDDGINVLYLWWSRWFTLLGDMDLAGELLNNCIGLICALIYHSLQKLCCSSLERQRCVHGWRTYMRTI